ncbi:3-keto-5-aminohexanoate cleavage enzyme [Natronincola peptidivorans]|uniref:3-keto-5-aminohexanoate cleavage enzyme n=1 Tax=Natronincola peptidivorans TaxID=426128 RepID=A0A1H9ZN11_9FIRM|nr:3-keto-5-aminohexanoate cleavage protein [Natronincola peptidivorans]SES83051.1 3-keto-5-aminohexanoate cleavage enzyme [Natronincola peptidivorans]
MEKLIITIAPTGNVPTKELNPNTPITADEIVETVKKCRELGASIAHLHVRDEAGQPTSDRGLFKEVVDKIHEEKMDVITQLSTGARGGGNTPEWRSQMLDLNIEMASLATGSSNFPNAVNANAPELIQHLINTMKENGVKPEIEAFDMGMIDNARYLMKKGILEGPLHFNLVMNVPGSIAGTPRNLIHMVESLPPDSTWSVTAIGKAHVPLLTMAIAMGGHVRTGLEDILEIRKGVPASNEMLMERVVGIAKAVGREIATPEEARKILSLK